MSLMSLEHEVTFRRCLICLNTMALACFCLFACVLTSSHLIPPPTLLANCYLAWSSVTSGLDLNFAEKKVKWKTFSNNRQSWETGKKTVKFTRTNWQREIREEQNFPWVNGVQGPWVPYEEVASSLWNQVNKSSKFQCHLGDWVSIP